MTQVTPEPNEERDRRRLTSDELIALFVAFTTLGSVIFWGFTRTGLDLGEPIGQLNPLAGDIALTETDRPSGSNRLGAGRLDLGSNEDTDLEQEGRIGLSDRLNLAVPTNLGGDRYNTREDQDESRSGRNSGALLPVPGLANGNTSGPTSGGNSSQTSGLDTSTTGSANASGDASGDTTSTDLEVEPEAGTETNSDTLPPAAVDLPEIEASREALNFQDVSDDYWAKPYIDALSSRQLIQGFDDTTFKPDEPVNRAQLAALINQAFVLSAQQEQIAFNDLGEAEWAQAAIEETVKGGFMTGFPDQSFQPNLPVPRVQVMTALVTGLQTQASGDVNATVNRYADKDSIPSWAIGKVAAATQAGLAVNYPDLTELSPNQPATRAEVAAMIYQALSYQGRLDPIESEYVVQP